jgi:hypothetical protein
MNLQATGLHALHIYVLPISGSDLNGQESILDGQKNNGQEFFGQTNLLLFYASMQKSEFGDQKMSDIPHGVAKER